MNEADKIIAAAAASRDADGDFRLYERYKQELQALELEYEEYTAAIRRLAEAVGV